MVTLDEYLNIHIEKQQKWKLPMKLEKTSERKKEEKWVRKVFNP